MWAYFRNEGFGNGMENGVFTISKIVQKYPCSLTESITIFQSEDRREILNISFKNNNVINIKNNFKI